MDIGGWLRSLGLAAGRTIEAAMPQGRATPKVCWRNARGYCAGNGIIARIITPASTTTLGSAACGAGPAAWRCRRRCAGLRRG